MFWNKKTNRKQTLQVSRLSKKKHELPEDTNILVLGCSGSGKARSILIPNESEFYYPWISCKDRLPEEKENPVTNDYYVYPVIYHSEDIIADIRYYSFGNGHWWHGPQIMDKYVTHWLDIQPPNQNM